MLKFMGKLFKKKDLDITEEERKELNRFRSCVKCYNCKFVSIFSSHCKRYGLGIDSDHLCDKFEWEDKALEFDLDRIREDRLEKQLLKEINYRKIGQ